MFNESRGTNLFEDLGLQRAEIDCLECNGPVFEGWDRNEIHVSLVAGGYAATVEMASKGQHLKSIFLIERWPPLAVVAAAHAHKPSRPVLMVDADPQGSLTLWHKLRNGGEPPIADGTESVRDIVKAAKELTEKK